MHDDSETGLYNTLRILRYILPNFHGQNSVKKSTKQYNGEIVVFELHTTQKGLKCQFSLFSSDINFFVIFVIRIGTFYVIRVMVLN